MQTTDVREAAQGAIDQSRSFLSRQVDAGTTELGNRVNDVAKDLRGVSDRLRVNSTIGSASTIVDRGADVIEQVGTYLNEADGERLLTDAEAVVRAQPLAVAAGAFIVGFAASRFLKTSSARRYAEGTASLSDDDLTGATLASGYGSDGT